jgi:hypothetical protein
VIKKKWTQQGLPASHPASQPSFLPVSTSAPAASSLSFSIFVEGESDSVPANLEPSTIPSINFSVSSVSQKDNNGGLKSKPTGFGTVKGNLLLSLFSFHFSITPST